MKIYQYPGNCGAGVLEGIYTDESGSHIQTLLKNLYKAKVDFSCLTWVTWSQYGDEIQKELQEYGEQIIASELFYSKHTYSGLPKNFRAYIWCLSKEARNCLCEGKWTLKKGGKPRNDASLVTPDASFSMNVGAIYPEGIPQLEPGWTQKPVVVKLPKQVAVAEPDVPKEAPKRLKSLYIQRARTRIRKRLYRDELGRFTNRVVMGRKIGAKR